MVDLINNVWFLWLFLLGLLFSLRILIALFISTALRSSTRTFWSYNLWFLRRRLVFTTFWSSSSSFLWSCKATLFLTLRLAYSLINFTEKVFNKINILLNYLRKYINNFFLLFMLRLFYYLSFSDWLFNFNFFRFLLVYLLLNFFNLFLIIHDCFLFLRNFLLNFLFLSNLLLNTNITIFVIGFTY